MRSAACSKRRIRAVAAGGAMLALSTSTAGCGRLLGADDVRFEDEPVPCVDQFECSEFAFDDPYFCRRNVCVRLRNDRPTEAEAGECKLVLGGNGPPAASHFVFGVLTALEEPEDPDSAVIANVRLALDEASVGSLNYALLAVVCNVSRVDPASLQRTLDYLTDELEVSAIFAPLASVELEEAFSRVHVEQQRDVFFLSPFQADGRTASFPDDGLLWHVLGDPLEMAEVYPPLVRRVEEYLHEHGSGDPLRVALLAGNDSSDWELASRVDAALSASRESGDEPYQFFELGLPAPDTNEGIRREIIDFRPHIVVAIAGDELLQLERLESEWAVQAPDQPPPFYVLSPHQAGRSVLDTVALAPGARERIVGVNASGVGDKELYENHRRSLEYRYPDQPDFANTGNFYDAVFFILYAAMAARSAEVLDGRAMAEGMTHLLEGPRFDMGGADISNAESYLRFEGESLSLYGTLGAPDFDVTTGVRRGSGTVWCVAEDEGALAVHYDVLRLDDSRGELSGTFDCFDGF